MESPVWLAVETGIEVTSPGVLGDVVDSQRGELAAAKDGGEPDAEVVVDPAPVQYASIPRCSPPSSDHLALVQLALFDPASANKREGPRSCDSRVGRHL